MQISYQFWAPVTCIFSIKDDDIFDRKFNSFATLNIKIFVKLKFKNESKWMKMKNPIFDDVDLWTIKKG